MKEISTLANAENIKEYCFVFSSQPCYDSFSSSLISYVAIFQSIDQFFLEKKSKFDVFFKSSC